SPDGRSLISGSEDATVLIWNVLQLQNAKRADRPPDEWDALADADAVRAYAAMRSLCADPQRAVLYLKERLKAALADDPAADRWVADLESNEFAARQAA